MKTLNKQNRINLAIIAVVLTLIVWALIKYEFMTYAEIKYAAGVVITLIGFFYQTFGKWEVEKESKRKDVQIQVLKNRVEIIEKRK